MNRLVLLLIAVIISSGPGLLAQSDPFDPIIAAMSKADARGISEYFHATVDLGLPGKDDTYSASQGEMVMKDFFRDNPPESFRVIQKGTTDEFTRFAICEYNTTLKNFQVYIHLRLEKEKYLIHKIKFEERKSATSTKNEH